MRKPHLFKCGRYWICAAGRFDHHILRGSLGATPLEAWNAFARRQRYAGAQKGIHQTAIDKAIAQQQAYCDRLHYSAAIACGALNLLG
jgi:hypothetical protein